MWLFNPNIKKIAAKGNHKSLIKIICRKKDLNIKKEALKSLIKISDVKNLENFMNSLTDNNLIFTIRTFGEFKYKKTVIPLTKMLNKRSYDIKCEVAEALGKIGDREAIRYLVPLLHDEFDLASREAALALDRLEWMPMNEDQTIAYYLAKWEWKKVEKFGSKAVDQLLVLLENCGWHRK